MMTDASRYGTGLERKVAREALKRACNAARTPSPEPTLHDLRHSHASMLIAMGVSAVPARRDVTRIDRLRSRSGLSN